MDIGQLIRLRASVKAAMESVPEGLAGTGGTALSEAYARSRIEVQSLIEGSDLVEEFNRLFQQYQPTVGRRDLLGQARTYGEARTHLARLAGWLDGLIESLQYEARLQAEAEAYARERVKAERGIGFQPDR